MATVRLSTRGRLTLPKEIRTRLGWSPGVDLAVEDRGDHLVIRRTDEIPETTLEDLVGCANYSGPARTPEEMEAAIAKGAAGLQLFEAGQVRREES